MADDGRQRGSVLMLMPAAVLIFVILGAIAVDYGGVFLAQAELANAAAAAGNDAATQAIDLPHLYATGEVRLVHDRARAVAQRSVAAKGLDHLSAVVEEVRVQGATVTVVLRGRADYLFARALPGGPTGADVTATSTSEAAEAQ